PRRRRLVQQPPRHRRPRRGPARRPWLRRRRRALTSTRRPARVTGPADNAPMVRPTQQLHALREPAPAHAAATLLLLRDTPAGLEVLMTRRSERASFAPGAYVFPGGRVD